MLLNPVLSDRGVNCAYHIIISIRIALARYGSIAMTRRRVFGNNKMERLQWP